MYKIPPGGRGVYSQLKAYYVIQFDPTPVLQIIVYTISAQHVRLTPLPSEFSIELPKNSILNNVGA